MAITIYERDPPYSGHRIFAVNLNKTDITVTVTAKASVARRWLSTTHYLHRPFLSHLVVGLGVQWTPGEKDAPADTLQLCVGRRCLVYQLTQATYVPNLLRRFLRNPCNTFVGFWNHSDRMKLKKSKHGLDMFRDPLDLRMYVETDDDDSLVGASVEEIVEECLGIAGVRLRREISMSDWDDEFLSEDQVLHASLDAHCAFLIGKNIRAWKFTR